MKEATPPKLSYHLPNSPNHQIRITCEHKKEQGLLRYLLYLRETMDIYAIAITMDI